MAKRRRARWSIRMMDPLARFSLLKAAEGGFSFNDAKQRLEANGVESVKRDYSPYVGHYGLSVPRKFEKRASRILFGR